MRRPGKKMVRFWGGQEGISLIETVVAIALLGLIGMGVLAAFNTTSKATQNLDEEVTATNLATAYLEAIREVPYDVTEPYYDDAVAGITIPPQYTVTINIAFSSDGTTWVDTYTDQTLQRVTVSVSREGESVFSLCTYRTQR